VEWNRLHQPFRTLPGCDRRGGFALVLLCTLSGMDLPCAFSPHLSHHFHCLSHLCTSCDSSCKKVKSQCGLFQFGNTWGEKHLLSKLESDFKFWRQVQILEFKSEFIFGSSRVTISSSALVPVVPLTLLSPPCQGDCGRTPRARSSEKHLYWKVLDPAVASNASTMMLPISARKGNSHSDTN